MKKVLAGLTLFSFLVVAGCNSPSIDNSQLLNQNNVQSLSTKSDWYATLSPELQDYYASAKGLTGLDLFEALHDIVSRGTKISSYGDSKSFMYATADNLKVNGKTGVYDAYSDVFVLGSGGNGNSYKENGDANKDGSGNDFINCEHTWPQSFFNKALPMVADLHHLQSTLSVPNNRRGHHPFGMATGKVTYSTSAGSKLSVSNNAAKSKTVAQINAFINLPEEESTKAMAQQFGPVFEPWDKQKGNTARALEYFMLRYYDQNIRGGEYDKKEFWDSKVSTFINWAEKVDPVNEEDIKRNNIVFEKQGNRNPFVDIPNLGSIIGETALRSK
ncbi:hypothetical protein EON78_06790 [bacterium]|nr:MAG: hypothetical protein EON78_06790 [bacterium]